MLTLLFLALLTFCGFLAGVVLGYNQALDEYERLLKRGERRR